jgi:hypothetical protein
LATANRFDDDKRVVSGKMEASNGSYGKSSDFFAKIQQQARDDISQTKKSKRTVDDAPKEGQKNHSKFLKL